MTKPDPVNPSRPGAGLELPLLVLLGLILAIAAGLYSGRMMRPARTAGAVELGAAAAGASLDVMVEVTAMAPDGSFEAALLEKRGDDYALAGRQVAVRLAPDAKFVMGGRDALKPGTVLQLHAMSDGRDLDASQVVFLTGYVKVE